MEAIPPRKKFAITNYTPPYEPTQRAKPRFKVIQTYNSRASESYSNSHKLFITTDAMRQIFHHIEWGKRTERNVVEQGGILLGHVFRDENEKLTYGIAEAAVAGSLAKGSSAYLEMTHETWKQMLDSVDEMLNQNPQKNLQVIGWYHTHPNELSVFMSGTDQATQRRLFSHDWQFAIVMNPHKQIWRAFYGVNADECRGFVIEGIQDSESSYVPEKLPTVNAERLEQDSNKEAQPNTKVFIQKTNLFSRLWHSVKMFFAGSQRGNAHTSNQAQTLPNQNRGFSRSPASESKINFFIWFYGFLLLLILLLQVINLYLQLFHSIKK